jgi:aminoglycoside phosphotransferase (APT) family kinase protein
MECSTMVFSHCDLGPYNIIVDRSQPDQLGLIDWEMAGFTPQAWLGTKFGVSFAMDFEWPGVPGSDPSVQEWRLRIHQRLGEEGYPEVVGAWYEWRQSRQVASMEGK